MRRAMILSGLAIMMAGVACSASYKEAPMMAYEAGGAYGGAPTAMASPMAPGAEGSLVGDVFDFDSDEIDGELSRGRALTGEADKKTDAAPEPSGEAPAVAPPKERVIIYVAQMGIFVFDVDVTLQKITEATESMGGWIQQSTSASLVIRVPVANFDALVATIEGMGDVDYKNVNGTDVTEEFFDLQIRLNNAMVMRSRFIELLGKATKVEESLAIERELGRLTEEIERIKGRLKYLQAHASNSTITVNVSKKPDVPPNRRGVALPFYWLRSYSLENVFY